MGVIIFNNISSSDLGLEVETFPAYEVPEKEYDVVHVPGRNGDLLIDNGTFSNVPRQDYYRMACYRESNSIENIFNQAGRGTINFDCRPQRYLKIGDVAVEFTSSGTITNPTVFPSKPIIKVYSSNSQFGTVRIGGYSFVLKPSSGSTSIEVDSEIQDVYDGYKNMNSAIVLNGGEFPKLMPGGNNIEFTANIQKVEVIPKWWTI